MDVIDAIASVSRHFRAANLKPPSTILLESHEEGMRFLSLMRQEGRWIPEPGSPSMGKPIEMADGSIFMECEVVGIAIRWPACGRAMPDGSWYFV